MSSSSSPPKASFTVGNIAKYVGKHGNFRCKILKTGGDTYTVRRVDDLNGRIGDPIEASLDEVIPLDVNSNTNNGNGNSSSDRIPKKQEPVSIHTTKIKTIDSRAAQEHIAASAQQAAKIPKKNDNKRQRDDYDRSTSYDNGRKNMMTNDKKKVSNKSILKTSSIKRSGNSSNDNDNDMQVQYDNPSSSSSSSSSSSFPTTELFFNDFMDHLLSLLTDDYPIEMDKKEFDKQVGKVYSENYEPKVLTVGDLLLQDDDERNEMIQRMKNATEPLTALLKRRFPNSFLSHTIYFTKQDINGVKSTLARQKADEENMKRKVQMAMNRKANGGGQSSSSSSSSSSGSSSSSSSSSQRQADPSQPPARKAASTALPRPTPYALYAPPAIPRILSRPPRPQMLPHDRPNYKYLRELFQGFGFEEERGPLPIPLENYFQHGHITNRRYPPEQPVQVVNFRAPRASTIQVPPTATSMNPTNNSELIIATQTAKNTSSEGTCNDAQIRHRHTDDGRVLQSPLEINIDTPVEAVASSIVRGIPIPAPIRTQLPRRPTPNDPEISERIDSMLGELTAQWENEELTLSNWLREFFHIYKTLGVDKGNENVQL